MGRRFDAIANRVVAYTVNILGSLAGIVAFGVVSYFRLPPCSGSPSASCLVLLFVTRRTWLQRRLLAASAPGRGHWPVELDARVATARPGRPITRSSTSQDQRVDLCQQHRPSGDGAGRARRARPTCCRTCSNRDAGGAAVRRRADHRRGLGQRRPGGPAARGRRTSTRSRSTRCINEIGRDATIPTAPTATRG